MMLMAWTRTGSYFVTRHFFWETCTFALSLGKFVLYYELLEEFHADEETYSFPFSKKKSFLEFEFL